MTSTPYPLHVQVRIESRETRLQELGYRDYGHYLASPAWAKVKAHYRKLVIEQCGLCGGDEQLNLHHMTYERVGEESMFDVTWLCRNCHRMVHELERRGELGLDFGGFADFERAARYAVEQTARRQASEADVAAAKFAPEKNAWHIQNICQQMKQRVRELPADEARSLMDDIRSMINEFEKSCREGYEYVPRFSKS